MWTIEWILNMPKNLGCRKNHKNEIWRGKRLTQRSSSHLPNKAVGSSAAVKNLLKRVSSSASTSSSSSCFCSCVFPKVIVYTLVSFCSSMPAPLSTFCMMATTSSAPAPAKLACELSAAAIAAAFFPFATEYRATRWGNRTLWLSTWKIK